MRYKYPQSHEIHVDARWTDDNRGTISGHDGLQARFDSPAAFGGRGKHFYPDELFIGSIIACFTTTLISQLSSFDDDELLLEKITLEATATLYQEDNYVAREIVVGGEIIFLLADDPPLIKRLIGLARNNCHILASISPGIKIVFEIDLIINKNGSGQVLKEHLHLPAD